METITARCVIRHRAQAAFLGNFGHGNCSGATLQNRPHLPDGQRVLIGTFEDVSEARKRVAAFSEYWPGDYAIVSPNYEQRADR